MPAAQDVHGLVDRLRVIEVVQGGAEVSSAADEAATMSSPESNAWKIASPSCCRQRMVSATGWLSSRLSSRLTCSTSADIGFAQAENPPPLVLEAHALGVRTVPHADRRANLVKGNIPSGRGTTVHLRRNGYGWPTVSGHAPNADTLRRSLCFW